MKVITFLMSNAKIEFSADNERNAKEIAKRIITEGLWVENEDGTTEFYPVHQIFKVKIKVEEVGDKMSKAIVTEIKEAMKEGAITLSDLK